MPDNTDEPVSVQPKKLSWNPVAIVIITIGLFFLSQLIAGAILLAISLGAGWDQAQLSSWFKVSAFPQFIYVLMADVLMLIGVRYLLSIKKQSFKDIGLSKPRMSDAGRALLAYGVYVVIFIILSLVAKKISPSLNLEQKQELGFEANRGTLNLILAGFSLVVLPPIVEEIVTRGFLYTGLRSRLKVVPAAIITSLVFAAAHLQFGSDAPLLWVAAIDTFTLSLVLVYLRETTGHLAAPMFLHMYKNLVAFSVLFIFIK